MDLFFKAYFADSTKTFSYTYLVDLCFALQLAAVQFFYYTYLKYVLGEPEKAQPLVLKHYSLMLLKPLKLLTFILTICSSLPLKGTVLVVHTSFIGMLLFKMELLFK